MRTHSNLSATGQELETHAMTTLPVKIQNAIAKHYHSLALSDHPELKIVPIEYVQLLVKNLRWVYDEVPSDNKCPLLVRSSKGRLHFFSSGNLPDGFVGVEHMILPGRFDYTLYLKAQEAAKRTLIGCFGFLIGAPILLFLAVMIFSGAPSSPVQSDYQRMSKSEQEAFDAQYRAEAALRTLMRDIGKPIDEDLNKMYIGKE